MRTFKTILLGLSVAVLPASIAFAAEKDVEQQNTVEAGAPAGQQGYLGLSPAVTGGIAIGGILAAGIAVGASNNDEGGGATATTGTTP